MFFRSKRLSTAAFDDAFNGGRSVHTPFFHVRYRPTSETARFSVAVSKKVCASAVARHRLKRRVFALLREHETPLPLGDYIFFPKKEADTLDADLLRQAVVDAVNVVGSRPMR